MNALDTLAAALCGPTPAEADELQSAVAEAAAAGGGFVAVWLEQTSRLFVGLVTRDGMPYWNLEPATSAEDAQSAAEAHAVDLVAFVARLQAEAEAHGAPH